MRPTQPLPFPYSTQPTVRPEAQAVSLVFTFTPPRALSPKGLGALKGAVPPRPRRLQRAVPGAFRALGKHVLRVTVLEQRDGGFLSQRGSWD